MGFVIMKLILTMTSTLQVEKKTLTDIEETAVIASQTQGKIVKVHKYEA
jgi:hypothetical protein